MIRHVHLSSAIINHHKKKFKHFTRSPHLPTAIHSMHKYHIWRNRVSNYINMPSACKPTFIYSSKLKVHFPSRCRQTLVIRGNYYLHDIPRTDKLIANIWNRFRTIRKAVQRRETRRHLQHLPVLYFSWTNNSIERCVLFPTVTESLHKILFELFFYHDVHVHVHRCYQRRFNFSISPKITKLFLNIHTWRNT